MFQTSDAISKLDRPISNSASYFKVFNNRMAFLVPKDVFKSFQLIAFIYLKGKFPFNSLLFKSRI